jgi:hypothetical protein
MGGNSQWNKAVNQAFKAGKRTNKNYSLKEAMFDAKKIYKKSKNAVVSLGKQTRRRTSSKKRHNRRKSHKGGSDESAENVKLEDAGTEEPVKEEPATEN